MSNGRSNTIISYIAADNARIIYYIYTLYIYHWFVVNAHNFQYTYIYNPRLIFCCQRSFPISSPWALLSMPCNMTGVVGKVPKRGWGKLWLVVWKGDKKKKTWKPKKSLGLESWEGTIYFFLIFDGGMWKILLG